MTRELLVTGDEIGTKGGNRSHFEDVLRRNVWNALGRRADIVPRRLFGRLSIPLPEDVTEAFVTERLTKVPGVARFSIARGCSHEVEAMQRLALDELRGSGAKSFGVRAQRAWKNFPLKSQDLEREVGGFLKQELDIPVDLTDPDLWVHVLVTEQGSYVATQRQRGLGGLPVRSSGKVICLLSGGLDSPVAAYKMFFRGCQVIFCHFLNQGQDPLAVETKIEDLVEVLTGYQQRSPLYVLPFEELQRELIAHVPGPFRMLAYRRVMMRVANLLAVREGAGAVVTGDVVGQVASQTMTNLHTIWAASDLPVFAPLMGMRKQETVAIAKEIGTYPISIEPYADCCQYMIPESPATRSTPAELEAFEAAMTDLPGLEAQLAAGANPRVFHFPPPTDARYPKPPRRSWPRGQRG